MTYVTYQSRVLSLLAKHPGDSMHRSEILAAFPEKKIKYLVRAIVRGVEDGSILALDNDQFKMNWHFVNREVEQDRPEHRPEPDA